MVESSKVTENVDKTIQSYFFEQAELCLIPQNLSNVRSHEHDVLLFVCYVVSAADSSFGANSLDV